MAATNPGTAAVTRTLTVPTGLKLYAMVNYGIVALSGDGRGTLTSLDETDRAPGVSTNNIGSFDGDPAHTQAYGRRDIRTNTSGQIRSRQVASDANLTLYTNTVGYRVPREVY